MWKKSLTYALILWLTALTIGLRVQVHFSGDELYDASLFGNAETCCDIQCGCCDEATYDFQLNTDFLTSSPQQLPNTQTANIRVYPLQLQEKPARLCMLKPSCHSAPQSPPRPAFLQVFLL